MPKTLNRLKIQQVKPLGREVYEALRESIINGELRPRERLIEENLAAETGASRTPVREAIKKLESEGLVTKLPKGGFIVRPLTVSDIEEVFGILSVLESYAAYLATIRLKEKTLSKLGKAIKRFDEARRKKDPDKLVMANIAYHDVIYKASGSKMLQDQIHLLRDYFHRYRRVLMELPDMATISNKEHRAVLEAMRDHDAETVEQLVRKHVLRGGSILLNAIKNGRLEL